MNYDDDKTKAVLQKLAATLSKGTPKDAAQLLLQADSSGALQADPSLYRHMQKALGQKHAEEVTEAFVTSKCPYCSHGREKCAECQGQGFAEQASVCQMCAGLGLCRCPFCNGTALAGYDLVPRGLRPTVLALRLRWAQRQLRVCMANQARAERATRETGGRILHIDRLRCILANASEQASLSKARTADGQPVYTPARKHKLQAQCRQLNGKAEALMSGLLRLVAERYAARALRKDLDAKQRAYNQERAKSFAKLISANGLSDSALKTPFALRR
jgi:hypothetical protein